MNLKRQLAEPSCKKIKYPTLYFNTSLWYNCVLCMLLSLRCWRNVHLLSSFIILISLLRPCDGCFIVCSLLFLFRVSYVSIIGKMQDGNMENNQTKGNLLLLWALTAGLFPLFSPTHCHCWCPLIRRVFSVLSLLILSAASSECVGITWVSWGSGFFFVSFFLKLDITL